MKKFTLLAIVALAIASCNTDEDANRNAGSQLGNATFTFDNVIEGQDVELQTATYTNPSDETYIINELKYIITNVAFVRANGSEYVVPEGDGNFLINEEVSASKTINFSDVPAGDYTSVRIGFGVDQSKYPLNGMANFIPMAEDAGMLWSWSAGYKFLKFEGEYTVAGGTDSEIFLVHVGSHGTTLDNYKEITIPMSNYSIGTGTTTSRAITADINKIFNGNSSYAFADKDEVMVDPTFAPIISNNMTTVFSIQ